MTNYQRKVLDASSAEICDERTIASRAEQFLLSAQTDCGGHDTSPHSVSVDPSTGGGAAVDGRASGTVDPAAESLTSVSGVSGRLDSSLYTAQKYV